MKTLKFLGKIILVALVSIFSCPVFGQTVLFRNGLDGYTGTMDATTNQGVPNTSYGSAYWPLYIRANGAGSQCTTLIKFSDLNSSVSAGFVVQSARVGLTGFYGIPGSIDLKVSEMLKPWDNTDMTWSADGLTGLWASGGALGTTANGSIPADCVATPMDTVSIIGGTVLAGQTVWFDLDPQVVQNWIDDSNSNNGMVFFSDDGQSNYFYVVGRIGTGDGYDLQRPQLEIIGEVVSGPKIVLQDGNGYTGTMDATTNQGGPNTAYGSAYWPLYIRANGSGNQCTTLVKFSDIASFLPSSFDQVLSARVGLTGFYGISGSIDLKVSKMLKPWDNTDLTWLSDGLGSNWSSAGALGTIANGSIPADRVATPMDVVSIVGGIPAGQTVWFDLDPQVVQNWIDDSNSNNGMVFFSDDGSANYFYVVGRIGAGDTYPQQRPQLEITSTPTCSDVMSSGHGIAADLNHDCYVNLKDLAVMGELWFECYDPANSACDGFYVEPEPIDYVINQGLPVIDGVINTSEWASASWNQMDEIYDGDPCDLSGARWAAMWNPTTNLIYIAITGTDTQRFTMPAYDDWNSNDDVEVYIDSTNSNAVDYYTDYSKAQQYICAPDGSGGQWAVLGALNFLPAGAIPSFRAVVSGNTISYEIALTPYQLFDINGTNSQIMPLSIGKVIGLDAVMGSKTNSGFGMKCQNTKAGKFGDASKFMNCKLE